MGRPKGSKNLDSLEYQLYWIKRKICIPEKEELVLKESLGQYKEAQDPKVKIGFLSIYAKTISEIAARIYPKLKAIEVQKVLPGWDELTPEEQVQKLLNEIERIKKNV